MARVNATYANLFAACFPVSALPTVARMLNVSLEGLFGGEHNARRKRGLAPQWVQHIEAIFRLPKAKQRFVVEMLQTVLAQS